MSPLGQAQLVDLEEAIVDRLAEVLRQKNEDGTLERMLREMGLDDVACGLAGIKDPLRTWPDGKIAVFGAPPGMANDLKGVCKSLGIDKERLELVGYEDITNYGFHSLSYSTRYCAILFGATPHSARGMEGDSSILVHVNHPARKGRGL